MAEVLTETHLGYASRVNTGRRRPPLSTIWVIFALIVVLSFLANFRSQRVVASSFVEEPSAVAAAGFPSPNARQRSFQNKPISTNDIMDVSSLNETVTSAGDISIPELHTSKMLSTNNNEEGDKKNVSPPAADEDPDGKLSISELATNRVWQRKNEYELQKQTQTFFIRGIGYLYLQQKMVLAAVPQFVDLNQRIQLDADGQPNTEAFDKVSSSSMKPGINKIKIYNVYNQTSVDEHDYLQLQNQQNQHHKPRFPSSTTQEQTRHRQNEELRNDCFRLTMWVRVLGPEIIAGSAVVINATDTSSCHWEFPFDLQVAGKYEIDAKILLWDGHNTQQATCSTSKIPGALAQGNLDKSLFRIIYDKKVIHQGFKGFKLYSPDVSCCEICTRMKPYCIYFLSVPLYLPDVSIENNGCELYYRSDTPNEHILTSRMFDQPAPHSIITKNATYDAKPTASLFPGLAASGGHSLPHGEPHDVPTVLFLGCGWSNWHSLDFACLSGEKDDQVYTPYKFFTFDPEDKNQMVSTARAAANKRQIATSLSPTTTAEDKLPLCKLEHENVDFNPYHRSGRWVRLDFNDTSLCPVPFKFDWRQNDKHTLLTKVIPNHPQCWHRDDFRAFGNFCAEQNCDLIKQSSQWISSLHNESQFMGVWRNYKCDYQEFTTSQLQQCITKRKISSITTQGRSMAEFFRVYLDQRLEGIQFYPAKKGSLTVILHTAAFVHQLRRTQKRVRKILRDIFPSASNRAEIYWASGQYLSSERDTNVHLGRTIARHPAIEKILNEEKGYKMLNFFDLTAAFTYDTAGQHDGLHIGGPPMKVVITKLFHYMCDGIIEGSRM